jgi:uncharacterized OB-fold protein
MAERPAPVLTERNTAFWTGGERGQLLIARCQTCGWWLHPPLPVCRRCRGQDIVPEAVSGRATVWSFTVNRHQWAPGLTPPYIIAEVELAEHSRPASCSPDRRSACCLPLHS